jgi:ABC-2 type transport system permease protein
MSGLVTVFWKELADNFSSWRFIILFALVLLAGVFSIYVAAENIKEAVSEVSQSYFVTTEITRFIFLKLYTISAEILPFSFLTFIVFLVPIVGIALGFDAINSERNSGTMGRLLSQPIYRDAVINGKFLAGVVTMAIMLVSIVMLVAGIGLWTIGIPPTAEEIMRLIAFLVVSIVYGAFWLGLAILFSIFFRRVATSALASIAIWIFFIFFITMFVGLIANMVVPVDDQSSQQELVRNIEVQITAMHISPTTLFEEASFILLAPGERTMGQILQLQTSGVSEWMLPSPLPLAQSLLIVWPQLVSLLALTAICFAISYIKFMREEIRST